MRRKLLPNNLRHLTERLRCARFELGRALRRCQAALQCWQKYRSYLVRLNIFGPRAYAFDRRLPHLRFAVAEEHIVRLNQVRVRQLWPERLGEICEVLGNTEAHFPRFVLASGHERRYRVLLVLLLGKVLRDVDQRFEAEYSNGILLVRGQLIENWQEVLNDILLFNFVGKLSQLRGTCLPYQRCVLVAQLHIYFS